MDHGVGGAYLRESLRMLRQYNALADRAVAQVDREAMFRAPDSESNSIAIIMKHMAGNMRSRWTDFLTSDGEKPDRNRDAEFEIEPGTTVGDVQRWWEDGWQRTLAAIEALGPEDLGKRCESGASRSAPSRPFRGSSPTSRSRPRSKRYGPVAITVGTEKSSWSNSLSGIFPLMVRIATVAGVVPGLHTTIEYWTFDGSAAAPVLI